MRINLDPNKPALNGQFVGAVRVKQMHEFDPNAEDKQGPPTKRVNKVTEAEEHRYEITALLVDVSVEFGALSEEIPVRVWSSMPLELPTGEGEVSPVAFGGLTMNTQDRTSGDGRGFTRSFAADTVTFEPKPSETRKAVKAEPPTPDAPSSNGKAKAGTSS